MDLSNPTSMRVLIRPPHPNPSPSSASPLDPSPSLPPLSPPPSLKPHSSPSPPAASPSGGGVVVVGFIGRRHSEVSQLMNRIIDSNVFGSGNIDKTFSIEGEEIGEEAKDWFKYRRISYYHEVEKGILYLQFCSTWCPVMDGFSEAPLGFDSALEASEFSDLQGMLFMFSVCHVIIFLQEGSRFDTQTLKRFRVLQSAKHAMTPFVRSRIGPPVTGPSSQTCTSGAASNNPSPGRSARIVGRNASAITLMSGLGSYTSLYPGQCTPVTLFVFLDDLSDVNSCPSAEESSEASSSNQSASLNGVLRPSLPLKGSGSVIVLARPASKSEGGFRKKLQSSLEAQLRFSIKKCRTLSNSESSHSASRSGGISNSAPLFSLDASKAVALVDRYSIQGGESLEFAIGLVEDVLNGKATSDTLLLEMHSQSANKEDILNVKEFICRQSDILRGRGGLVANTNSGSAAGVGMVAVAAAAAAASASGKTFTTPELPSLGIWLSCSQLILHGILSAKRGCVDELESNKRKSRQRNATALPIENIAVKIASADPLDIAVSYLESGKGLNTNFSTLWCQKALPIAKDIYINELPAFYPTSQHEAHLEKALCAFKSMVKGPSVQVFAKKLEDECTSIWSSGRQLCDAISLTGKPCMHPRHDVETIGLLSMDGAQPHSSGFFFLHACACGRSRKLRSDPFDFGTANVTFNCFPDCDKLLPALQLPQGCNSGPVQPSSWSLIRVGGARYYKPSKGLLQSGFCATQKFLLKWTIFIENQCNANGPPASPGLQVYANSLAGDTKVGGLADESSKRAGSAQLHTEEMQNGIDTHKKPSSESIKSDDAKIGFGRGLPNFTMRKPFAAVVAGSAADSGFAPFQRKQPSLGSEEGAKQHSARDKGAEQVDGIAGNHGSQKVEQVSSVCENLNGSGDGYPEGNPFLQIGSNVVPVNMGSDGKVQLSTSLKQVVVYVGLEHECPHGHRFILTSDHLNELGSPYVLPEESHVPSSVENSDFKVEDSPKLGRNVSRGKFHRHLNGMVTSTARKVRNLERSKDRGANDNLYLDGLTQLPSKDKEQSDLPRLANSVKDLEASLQSVNLDDGQRAFSLLNRNVPIYMNCPHCKILKKKKDPPSTKFAGTTSQLQRIFVVTPPFPVVLVTCPVVQFEASCLPPSVVDREQKLRFSLGCQVILPPECFLSLRLPFVYGLQLDDGSLCPFKPFENKPELTAWINKGTILQVMPRESKLDESLLT